MIFWVILTFLTFIIIDQFYLENILCRWAIRRFASIRGCRNLHSLKNGAKFENWRERFRTVFCFFRPFGQWPEILIKSRFWPNMHARACIMQKIPAKCRTRQQTAIRDPAPDQKIPAKTTRKMAPFYTGCTRKTNTRTCAICSKLRNIASKPEPFK